MAEDKEEKKNDKKNENKINNNVNKNEKSNKNNTSAKKNKSKKQGNNKGNNKGNIAKDINESEEEIKENVVITDENINVSTNLNITDNNNNNSSNSSNNTNKKKNKKNRRNNNKKDEYNNIIEIDDLDDIDKISNKENIVIKSKEEKRVVLDAVGKVKVDDVETEEQLEALQEKTNQKLKEIENLDKKTVEKDKEKLEKEEFEDNIQKKVIEKLGKNHKRKIAIITILLLIIAICIVSTIFSVIYMGKDVIAPNIQIGTINIGGLTKEEAKEKISKRYEEKAGKEIRASLKDYEQIIKPEMVEFTPDINKIVDLAYMEGRNGNIIENNYTIISRYFSKKNLDVSYSINEELMKKLLEEISGKIPEKVKEPSYNIDGTKLFVYPGAAGNEVNKLALREKIISIMRDVDKISDEDLKITIPVDTKQPNNIDIEKIHNEIYEKPENAEYNEQTKELKLDKDGLDFAITMEEAKNIIKENKDEYIIPLKKIKAEITYDKLGKDIFPDLLRNISNKL